MGQAMAQRAEILVSDVTRTSKEKLPDWLRRWYALKGELRFREAADEIERLQRANAELLKRNVIASSAHEPPAARKCVHCNGNGVGQVCCGQPVEDHGEVCCGNPDVDVCETCYGEGTITTIDQYVKTLPADWHKDSSLERWFPLTAQELKLQRDRIIDLESRATASG
jgi:hypothetical protein